MKAPEISRISQAWPGETAEIFGENLGECEVFLFYPPEEINPLDAFTKAPFPPLPAEAVKLETISAGNQVLFAEIPYSVPYGCCLLWVRNGGGEVCSTLNRPEVWNQSLEIAFPDDRFTFYGQNYYGEDQRYFINTTCVMKNISSGQVYKMRWGVSQDMQQSMPGQNDHRSDYSIPADVPAGEYLVSMTNGTGGPWGWTEPRHLIIKEKKDLIEHCGTKWNAECRQNTIFDMSETVITRIDPSLGDGFSDATKAITSAISETAVRGGGYVILPPGRFGITKTLRILPGVVLRGAGAGATVLTVPEGKTLMPDGMPPVSYASRASDGKNWSRDWKPYMDRDNNTPLVWIETRSGMEDISIEGGSGVVILALVGTTDESPSEDVFFNRVVFENGISSALYCHGNVFDVSYHGILTTGHTKNLSLFKCSVKASFPLMILPAQCVGLRMVGNTFEVSPRQSGDCVYASGLYGAVITENTFLYGRRSLISQQGMFDSWIFQNRSIGVANTTNANEEYMSEYGQSAWVGKAKAVGINRVTVPFNISAKRMLQRGTVGENLSEHRWFLMIMQGRGLGQYRVVDHVEGNTIYLTEDWEVLPDGNTVFNLITASQHNIWALNFAGTGSGNSQFIYGSGIENIVTGHSMILASGISMYAMMTQRSESREIADLGVVAFCRISNCDCRYSGMGLCLWTNESWSLLDDRDQEYVNQIGNIVRWNSFVGGADSGYVKNQTFWTPVKIESGIQAVGMFCLMENNLIAGYDTGIHLRYSSHGNLLRRNSYKHNLVDLTDDGHDNILKNDTVGMRTEKGGQRNKDGGWYYDDGRIQTDLELH